MRHWLLRRPPHYSDIQPSLEGRPWDYDKVDLNELLQANDLVYLMAAYGELYGWGYVIKVKPYRDTEMNAEKLTLTVTRPVVRNNLIPAEELKRIPALARAFSDSDLIIVELKPHQVNSLNRLIRSKGVEAPEDIEEYKNPDMHLDRLVRIYESVGGSRAQLVELMGVLNGEFSDIDEAWDEADYMKDEGWVEIIADNGPPLLRLAHKGVKRAEEYLAQSPRPSIQEADTLTLRRRYCPKCNKDYSSEQYDFCTEDGTPLVSDSYDPDADTAK